MAYNNLALSEHFDDADSDIRLPFEWLLAAPEKKYLFTDRFHFSHAVSINNSPASTSPLLRALGNYIFGVNKRASENEKITLYIPDLRGNSAVVHANNIFSLNKARETVKTIVDAHADGKLRHLNIRELVQETLRPAKSQPQPRNAFSASSGPHIYVSPAKQKELYLSGASHDILETGIEVGHSNIQFSDELEVLSFDGERKKSYNRLRHFLLAKLNVSITPSHNPNCVKLEGTKRDVHIAHLMGRKLAPLIDKGTPVDDACIKKAYRSAESKVGAKIVNEILGDDGNIPDRRRKIEARKVELRTIEDSDFRESIHKTAVAREFEGSFRTYADVVAVSTDYRAAETPQNFATPAP